MAVIQLVAGIFNNAQNMKTIQRAAGATVSIETETAHAAIPVRAVVSQSGARRDIAAPIKFACSGAISSPRHFRLAGDGR
jgi:hypothetical protein